ncbi:AMP-binding acetyl-CoA synthetase [Solimonas sp. K1W22B-7]|uniref:AMP-binding protein n=1 Tax=Solimonas sp. K1W22B-7 TaxID=2303331 RepID=UPI000E332993|nr:AMP-binding protein [Solimonas sp. K1W22B-7]AXQ27997.1 AMP-binding acetyl-CoA synthetase [Solimonas sp. K1W22B-7]
MSVVADQNLPLQRIWHWEKERASKVFLTQPIDGVAKDYTWAQAVDEARRVAAWLQAQGLPPGSNVALMSKNCAHWIMADMAIMMAGYVSVPLYPTLTAHSVRQIMEHSEARAIFAGRLDAWDEMLKGVPEGVLRISFPYSPPNAYATWDDIVARTEPLEGNPVRPPGELATIMYTSGTTGMPKGVMHSFATLGWMGDFAARSPSVGASSEDRGLSYLPLSHAAERSTLEVGAFRTGSRLYFTESLETFLADLRRARPTMFISVPRLWVKFQQGVSGRLPEEKLQRLLRVPLLRGLIRSKILKQLGLDSVRMAGSGAAPLPEATMNWYRGLGLELLEGYGMTEFFGLTHMCQKGSVRVGYVGQPIDGVKHKLSEVGEILCKSPCNTLGYYKEPEKTRELFTEDGYIRTGDKGSIDELGRLKITGRVKELFKTAKGKFVAPAPIENKLAGHPDVEACCVTGGAYQGQPCAVLMLSPEAMKRASDPAAREAMGRTIAAHVDTVNAELDDHEQLDFVTVVAEQWNIDNGFLTPTLKIKRNIIDDTYGPKLEGWYAQRKPVIWQ